MNRSAALDPPVPELAPGRGAALRRRATAAIAFWRERGRALLLLGGGFALLYILPIESPRFDAAVRESLALGRWYAREHVLLCLVPAFFIAGAIGTFVSQAGVMRYLGARAHPVVAYGVASISGSVLAVCSCTVLPLFAGIHHRGAGLGPAVAFLYSGPAINALAIILTARVLGIELGLARALFAILFSLVVGVAMALLFRREERRRSAATTIPPDAESGGITAPAAIIASLVVILVFANWSGTDAEGGLWAAVFRARWGIVAAGAVTLGGALARQGMRLSGLVATGAVIALGAFLVPGRPVVPFSAGAAALALALSAEKGPPRLWIEATWDFTKQIMPLLLGGVLVAGLLLGRPGHEGLVPSSWIERAVGGDSPLANLFAAAAGALMYFATLTEIPILQGLLGSGMGGGPALALLLAGPALSLPSMIVIAGVLGVRKTATYVLLVVVAATLSGLAFGALVPWEYRP